MPGLEAKNFASPDEVRPYQGKGKLEVLNLGGTVVGRGTCEPGWQWSVNVGPIAGTDSCQSLHLVYIVSGRMRVKMNDGTEGEAGPGDVVHIDPGHDAWTIGDESCVFLDFGASVAGYAKR